MFRGVIVAIYYDNTFVILKYKNTTHAHIMAFLEIIFPYLDVKND